ncbi:MAG: hypothetical protein FJ293_02100 [Planctomycetes bacterium]|nr:hypothetical protein [Planctomycetota bacterium]
MPPATTPPPDAPHRAAVRALRQLGGEVRVFAGACNSVRPREPGEAVADGSDPHPLPFVLEVEGTPNLFHELAHVVLLGRLERDHGTAAARIPFDLATEAGAQLLREELACCIESCAWHGGSRREVEAWFDEQVDIQPCFFRRDDDLAAFLRDAAAAIARAPARFVATCRLARRRVRTALIAGGLPPTVRPPHARFTPQREWLALLARHGLPGDPEGATG